MTVNDRALSQALEQTEALSNRALVEARASLDPASGATWIRVADAYALYDGVGSPLTQVFGLGLSEPTTEDHLAAIESFFDGLGADTTIELSPLAEPSLLTWLPARGYVPVELTSVLHRTLDDVPDVVDPQWPRVRQIAPEERGVWADRSADGWSTEPAFASLIRELAWVSAHAAGMHGFVAEDEGRIIGTGGPAIHGSVALLAGASTLVAFRGRGAQSALQAARLQFARESGCMRAMQCAAPGSTSQLNAERRGFRIAYTRIKWQRRARR
jgi:GNAT superfamily N-acetyltransferase